jgi:hypothetical protein
LFLAARRDEIFAAPVPEPFRGSIRSPPSTEENAMKTITCALAIALLGLPAVAMAQKGGSAPAPGPGQSEWAPGQRATPPGGAKKFAPGQRFKEKDVKGQPGASEYAPGHLPNKDVKR